MSQSIRARLMLLVATAIIPPLLLVLHIGNELRAAALRTAQQDAVGLAQSVAAQQERVADSAHQLLLTLAELPAVRHQNAEACTALFKTLTEGNPYYANILFISKNGTLIAAGAAFSPLDLSDRKYFRDAIETRDLAYGEYVFSRTTNRSVIHFAYPASDLQGNVIGVLAVAIDLEVYGKQALVAGLPKDSGLALTDHKGTVLFRFPELEEVIGQHDLAQAMAAMTGPTETGTFVGQGFDGVTRLYGYVRLRLHPNTEPYIYIRAGVPIEAALAPARAIERRGLVAMGIAGLLALALAWLLADAGIVRRLNALVKASARLGSGDLAARTLLPHGEGELGQLAKSFDTMAQTLEERERGRAQAESALRKSLEQLAEAQRLARVGDWKYDTAQAAFTWSPEAAALLGFVRKEKQLSLEDFLHRVHPDDVAPFLNAVGTATTGGIFETEFRCAGIEDQEHFFYAKGQPFRTEGTVSHVFGAIQDITERKFAEEERHRLEAQVQHSQKLESLGILAGGIAHDFNNLLSGILGNADLALFELPPNTEAAASIQHIIHSARRAADLTRQMLAYSGQSRLTMEPLNLSVLVHELGNLLSASIPKKCVTTYDLAQDLPAINGDQTQIRQVAMNLILNAAEAIGDGPGTVTVRTGHMHYTQDLLSKDRGSGDPRPGEFVFLEVEDTGCGMSPDVQNRLFDPFFTTKFTGRGLGLAAVQGIVRSHRGAIMVDSTLGAGTTIRVCFPSAGHPAPAAIKEVPRDEPWTGSGVILVVDDEYALRLLAQRMLERVGFEVVTAGDGTEAIPLFKQHQSKIRAVLLDMAMPIMDGPETFDALRQIDKEVRVILSSGFNVQEAGKQFTDHAPAAYLQKPYQSQELLDVLRRVLDK